MSNSLNCVKEKETNTHKTQIRTKQNKKKITVEILSKIPLI